VQRLIVPGAVQCGDHVIKLLDRGIVNRDENVAALQADGRRRRPGRNVAGYDVAALINPEHAIFNFVPRRAQRHIGGAKTEQDRQHQHRCPRANPAFSRRRQQQSIEPLIQSDGAKKRAENSWRNGNPLDLPPASSAGK
jgi:hypothetical protein